MTEIILVDTNIFVYVYDDANLTKQDAAVSLTKKLVEYGAGAVSTQVLSEFFSAAVRKLLVPAPIARDRLLHYVNVWRVLDVTADIVLNAARGVVEHQLNYWDALLWATALANNIPYILSEDFQDGIRVEGVRVLNPFKAHFDLDRLLN